VAGSVLYEIAGYDTRRLSSNDVFAFDGKAWHPGPSLPVALNHPGVASIGTDVYVAGGFTPGGATNRVFVLHQGAQTWQEIAAMRRARGALSLLALQGNLYAFGGRSGAVEVAVPERYDPVRGAWSDLPAMPAPRNHGAGYVSGAMIAAQGRLGRSWGCPAVRPAIARALIDAIKDGSLLVAYFPDARWLAGSAFLAAGGSPTTSRTADPS